MGDLVDIRTEELAMEYRSLITMEVTIALMPQIRQLRQVPMVIQ